MSEFNPQAPKTGHYTFNTLMINWELQSSDGTSDSPTPSMSKIPGITNTPNPKRVMQVLGPDALDDYVAAADTSGTTIDVYTEDDKDRASLIYEDHTRKRLLVAKPGYARPSKDVVKNLVEYAKSSLNESLEAGGGLVVLTFTPGVQDLTPFCEELRRRKESRGLAQPQQGA